MNHVFQKLPEKASGANRKAGARVREMGIRNELSRHRGRSEKVAPRLLAKRAPSRCTLELSAPTQLCRRMAVSPARPMGHLLSAGGAQSAEWEGHRGGAQSRKSQSWGGGVGEGRGTPAFRSPVGDPRQAALAAPHEIPLGSPLALAPPPPLASPGCPRASICSSYSSATWMAVSQALAGPTLHLGFWSSVLRVSGRERSELSAKPFGEFCSDALEMTHIFPRKCLSFGKGVPGKGRKGQSRSRRPPAPAGRAWGGGGAARRSPQDPLR